jgi:beta-aspartyl-peptidase (threonine type)
MRCFAAVCLGFVIAAAVPGAFAQGQTDEPPRYAIVIHGGAGSSPESWSAEDRQAREKSLTAALTLGRDILAKGGTSLDAVEQVIRHLEDDPAFNAGRGAVLNAAGKHELDASIMDGSTLACGAVGGVRTVKNPISLARLVMTETRHVLLVAEGAEAFADQMDVERVPNDHFTTADQREDLQRVQAEQPQQQQTGDDHMGTVGCVALDQHGNLAAGTSTGGLVNKRFGRIGDSPIIGAGTYADNRTCAVSCTGVGEEFIRNAIAYDVSARMAYRQQSLPDAVGQIIRETLKPGQGGIIAVSHDGTIAMDFNTAGMSRAAADSTGRFEVKLGK